MGSVQRATCGYNEGVGKGKLGELSACHDGCYLRVQPSRMPRLSRVLRLPTLPTLPRPPRLPRSDGWIASSGKQQAASKQRNGSEDNEGSEQSSTQLGLGLPL